jgi:hypothetical protein
VAFSVFAALYKDIRHPPLPLEILAVAYAVVSFVALICLVVDAFRRAPVAAREARDWLWLRREGWRDWRTRSSDGRPRRLP